MSTTIHSAKLSLLVLLALAASTAAHADPHTKVEKEVWSAVEAMFSSWLTGSPIESVYEHIHPEFVWWNNLTEVPGDYKAALAYDGTVQKRGMKASTFDIIPLQIKVVEGTATVNCYVRGMWVTDEASGTPQLFNMRYHATWKKHDGRWKQLSNYMVR